MLDKIKLDIGILDESQDDYITMKIEQALYDIDLYTNYNRVNIPQDTLDLVVQKLVVESFNKRGLEGMGYHSEGGATYTIKEKDALTLLFNYRKPTLVGIRRGDNEQI